MKDIHDQLSERYPQPEWALFFEVANGLGASHRRYADAVAMSLFPSRGLDVHGFEVKRFRGDWLSELKNPAKADVIASYCDFWWLVTSDDHVALKDEVPKTWGLLVSNGEALRQVKKPERLKPKAIDRSFMGAMFRRADQWAKEQMKNDARVVAARAEGHKAGLEERDWSIKDRTSELERVQSRVKEFEKASGLNIDTYAAERMGEAVKAFMSARKMDVTEDMERVAGWIEDTAKGLRERVEILKKAKPQQVPAP